MRTYCGWLRNPAPVGNYERYLWNTVNNGIIMGKPMKTNWCRISEPSTVWKTGILWISRNKRSITDQRLVNVIHPIVIPCSAIANAVRRREAFGKISMACHSWWEDSHRFIDVLLYPASENASETPAAAEDSFPWQLMNFEKLYCTFWAIWVWTLYQGCRRDMLSLAWQREWW